MTLPKLSATLTKWSNNYSSLSDKDKRSFIQQMYWDLSLGFADISKIIGSYPNRIRRDAGKYGIQIRTRGEAQKLALATGRHTHPTEGKKLSDKTKNQIGSKVSKSWNSASKDEKNRRKQMSKERWDAMPQAQKDDMQKAAGNAIRLAAKEGSKLEKFLHKVLIEGGYRTSCHREHMIKNEKMHIDLFCDEIDLAIEVDGPSHFRKIWSDKGFERQKQSDRVKNGLLQGKDLVVVRIQQKGELTRQFTDKVEMQILEVAARIAAKKPPIGERLIFLGDE